MLKEGGKLYVTDVVFSFEPADHARVLNDYVDDLETRVAPAFARQAEAGVREEFMTLDWIMEGLLRRAGFSIWWKNYPSPTFATYLCEKTGIVTPPR